MPGSCRFLQSKVRETCGTGSSGLGCNRRLLAASPASHTRPPHAHWNRCLSAQEWLGETGVLLLYLQRDFCRTEGVREGSLCVACPGVNPAECPQRGGGGRWAWAHRHSLMIDRSSRGEGLARCALCSPSLWATCRVKWTLVRTVLVRTKINSPAQRFAFSVQLPLTAASSQLPKAPGSINWQGKNMTHEHVSFSSLSWPDRFEQGPHTLRSKNHLISKLGTIGLPL